MTPLVQTRFYKSAFILSTGIHRTLTVSVVQAAGGTPVASRSYGTRFRAIRALKSKTRSSDYRYFGSPKD